MNIPIKFNDDLGQELELKLCETGGILIKISHPEDKYLASGFFLECGAAAKLVKYLDELKNIIDMESTVEFIKTNMPAQGFMNLHEEEMSNDVIVFDDFIIVENDIPEACFECIFLTVEKRHSICKICQVYYLGSSERE